MSCDHFSTDYFGNLVQFNAGLKKHKEVFLNILYILASFKNAIMNGKYAEYISSLFTSICC